MKYDEDVPVKVAINEAVEISKSFGGDDSASFVNGILGKMSKGRFMNSIYSVGQVNNYIKNMFQQDFLLNKIEYKR